MKRFKMNMCKSYLISIFFVLISYTHIQAQAYDGIIDKKIFAGFTKVGKNQGLEIKFETGLSDVISIGVGYKYLFYHAPPTEEYIDKVHYFIEKSDFGMLLNFHLFQKQISSTKYDIYAGVHVAFKSMGIHTGVKYNFSERIGVYFQVLQSFNDSFMGIGGSPDDFVNNFGRKFSISTGLSFNIN